MGTFSKDNRIERRRFHAQGGLCALCGKRLRLYNFQRGDQGAWNAHHMDGDWTNNTLGNCAVVCINEPENCHLRVAHGGDFANGPLAARSWFTLNRPPETANPIFSGWRRFKRWLRKL